MQHVAGQNTVRIRFYYCIRHQQHAPNKPTKSLAKGRSSATFLLHWLNWLYCKWETGHLQCTCNYGQKSKVDATYLIIKRSSDHRWCWIWQIIWVHAVASFADGWLAIDVVYMVFFLTSHMLSHSCLCIFECYIYLVLLIYQLLIGYN